MQAANLSLNGEGENMSKKAAGILLLAVGVGAALMYSRKAQAGNYALDRQGLNDATFYLNKNTTLFDKPPVDSGSPYFNLNLYDIFGGFYSDGISDYRREFLERDPDSVVPYDVQKTTGGVTQSFFERAADAVASVGGAVAYTLSLIHI